MNAAELYDRTAQELAKRWDLALSTLGIPLVRQASERSASFSPRFFFSSADLPQILQALNTELPHVVSEIIARADQIVDHRFDLLGYQDLDYGPHIDWHLDVVHGKRAPMRPWFKIPYLNFETVGDAKITWELNRHQHLTILAKAYLLTREARYAEELFRQWYDWQANNPYPRGINWSSSLEIAFRSLSWLWVWYLLSSSPVMPDRFAVDLAKALRINARHIERFLSTYFSPNTHLLGEGAALFFIGTLLAQCPGAKRWQRLGWTIVLQQAKRQVLPDGMHFEQSIYYHVYALDIFLHARQLATVNRLAVPEQFDQTIERMLQALSTLAGTGRLPRFGDDDGGRLFDGSRNKVEDLLDPLAAGAVLYRRPDFKHVAGAVREETLWLLGVSGLDQFRDLETQRISLASFALKSSGIYGICGSEQRSQLLVDAGAQGTGLAGHGHADALSIQLSVGKEALLVDPGTFVYVDQPDRDRFRGTEAHNTVVIDGLSQAEPVAAFKWASLPNVTVHRWVTSDCFDLFSASHDGYSTKGVPLRHRRDIYCLKSRFWLVQDTIEGSGVHDFEVPWHFAPGSLRLTRSGAIFVSRHQTALGLLFAAKQHTTEAVPDWYSEVYGGRQASVTLRLRSRSQLPVSVATLLIPLPHPTAALGQFRRLDSNQEGSSVCSYLYAPANGLRHRISFAHNAADWRCGSWSTDARFLHFVLDSSGGVQKFTACDVNYLKNNGNDVVKASSQLTVVECTEPDHSSQRAAQHAL